MFRLCVFGILPFLFLNLSGCNSGRCTVQGTVTYEDGSPVEAGVVSAEGTVDGILVSVQANIEKDGSFSLGGIKSGDGVLPGSYKVAVIPVSLNENEIAAGKLPAVDSKFTRPDTSGLTLDVKEGKNELSLKVTKPKPKTPK